MTSVDPQPPSPDLLGDLLGPLAIEGPSSNTAQSEQNIVSGLEGNPSVEASAIVPVGEQHNTVQVRCMVLAATISRIFYCFQ